MIESRNKPLTILLASPRGFCAGVDRAILIVERATERYGGPVHVRHEVVHDRTVVASLQAKGALFVEEPDDVPDDRSVVLTDAGRLGITTGTSAPDLLVDELVAAGRQRFDVAGEEVRRTEDKVVFKLPHALVA
jgi:4-hydroxy-3-methylbut-2-enyl diphosphate reductase IspH